MPPISRRVCRPGKNDAINWRRDHTEPLPNVHDVPDPTPGKTQEGEPFCRQKHTRWIFWRCPELPVLFEEDFGAPFGKLKVTKGHVISLQSAVDTKYQAYLDVQNELGAAYNEIREECAQKYYNKKYTELDEEQQKKIQEIYPQKISEAEPRKHGGK